MLHDTAAHSYNRATYQATALHHNCLDLPYQLSMRSHASMPENAIGLANHHAAASSLSALALLLTTSRVAIVKCCYEEGINAVAAQKN